ncbi:hypothetical protein ASD99_30375 [Mesorhizobium sp. Root695]|uniref:hypothetical protein n=1 Tax=Mesorhizobium sp. Root695 TaxID=1736589 RepID=UPI00070A2B2A|nr:hypothetical protein [Mesorhizobium sp. Root695]KRB20450.1 hypothetical protein ASD99_30375 [Mesorhizobium sp. Root695]
MSTEMVFQTHLVLGYIAWLLCFGAYGLPWLSSMDRVAAQRTIATLHSFRFFGLVFILPGVVSPDLPAHFAVSAAYGDFATGLLAMLALLTVRLPRLFWLFVVAFNLVGTVELVIDYCHAIEVGLPAHAEQLGAAYAIPIIYVPLLMITHIAAFYFLLRPHQNATQAIVDKGLLPDHPDARPADAVELFNCDV